MPDGGVISKKRKLKLIIAIVISLIFIFILLLFLIIMFAPLLALGVSSIGLGGTSTSGGNFAGNLGKETSINELASHWWPIGSDSSGSSDDIAATSISSNFGYRSHPITGEDDNHSGVDIAAVDGSVGNINIIASKGGTVTHTTVNCISFGETSCGGGYGNYIMIDHGDGTTTLYAHLHQNSIAVSAGETVTQGQAIAKMGSSGSSTGSHLHFEVRVNGSSVDPLNYISDSNPRPKDQNTNLVNGSDNKETICLTLKNNYSDNGIIALITNMNAESSFNPNAKGDGETSYGLCQWHNDRWDNLKNTFPDTYSTIGAQLDFLNYELKNNYLVLYDSLSKNEKNYRDLTYDFCTQFENPADTEKTCNNRADDSENFANYVKNGCK